MFIKTIILVSSMFLLVACQGDQVAVVEENINKITLDNESDTNKIKEARVAFEDLNDNERSQITNYDQLLAAEELFNQKIIDEVVEVINNIGTINVHSDELITAARLAFDTLSRDQQKHVPNLNVLLNAEKAYSDKVMETANQLVSDMKNLTANDFTLIEELRTVYTKLSDKQTRQLSDDVKNIEDFISTFKINLLDKQINSVSYNSGEPNENQITRISDMVTTYSELSQNEINSLVNKKQFDQIIKEYKKYYDAREKNDDLYKRYNFINASASVPYNDLMKFPDSFKDQKIALDIEILEVHKGNIITADHFIVKAGGNDQELYRLSDQREVKEPILSVGDSMTTFGEYKKIDTYVVFSEQKGFLSTNINREKLEEQPIPLIDLKYTSVDNLGVIADNNPLLSININEELELLKKDLYDFIKKID